MIYFDNCATTPMDPEACRELARVSAECFGNPSSIHTAGRCAARELDVARQFLAETIGARPQELVFTSSGTEANNFIIASVVHAAARDERRVHIITSAVEHPSVLKRLEFELREHPHLLEVTFVGVDSVGRLRLDELRRAIRDETRLISLLFCNNETGTLQDLDALAAMRLAHPHVLLHLDIVQSYGKLPLDVRTVPVDFLTVSGHKIYGPKGIGFAYVRDGIAVEPLVVGGAQERFRRGGTENVAAAAAFAAAVRSLPPAAQLLARYCALERLFFNVLDEERVEYILNGPADYSRRLPGIFNVSFRGVANKEDLLIACDLEGLMVSSTSACRSGVVKDSHVLAAMGVPELARRGALRIAFNKFHTETDIERGARILAQCAKRVASQARA
ncbi:MAG: cysteine desulfurase [Candidatus Sumerlaeaceae bacterium]|nr:cysteine desulfurase [Candidatus Sumerlaeaceae bacterium]